MRACATGSASLSTIASLTSGRPFTPLVGSDINGDGYANDRAFVFEPRSAADSELASGMQRLLESGLAHTRSCLCARSSARSPTRHTLAVRAGW